MVRESKNYWKTDKVAELFGITPRRVQQLTKDGVIKTVSTPNGNRYDIYSTVKDYISYLSDKAYGREKSKKESELKAEKMQAEIELKNTQNEMQQLKMDITNGKYIKVEQAKSDYQQFLVILRRLLLSIPSRVAGYMNGRIDPSTVRLIESDIDADIKTTMQNFVIAGVSDEESNA